MLSESELLEALKKGDESAWTQAFHSLYPCALRAAQHPIAGLTLGEAEDIAIESLSQLVKNIQSIKGINDLKALAITIAGRRAISERRKKSAEKRGYGQVKSLDEIKEETQGLFEPAERIATSLSPVELVELAGLLQGAMANLDPLTRGLIHDFLIAGMAYKELAAKYDISMSRVGVQLARGLKKIRAQFEESPRLLKELLAYLR